MASFTTYKKLKILDQTPNGAGGQALNTNFIEVANRIGPVNYSATSDPSSANHAPDYYVGSFWINISTEAVFMCIDSNNSSATWVVLGTSATPELTRFSFGTIDTTTITADSFNFNTEGAEAVTWEYMVEDGTNYRSGSIRAVWDSTAANVEYHEISTQDIGDTTPVTISVDHDSGNIRLRVTTTSNGWTIRGNRFLII
ncbi:MAG: hypothetical protein ACOC56_03500 [Atribacterota bacterium]